MFRLDIRNYGDEDWTQHAQFEQPMDCPWEAVIPLCHFLQNTEGTDEIIWNYPFGQFRLWLSK